MNINLISFSHFPLASIKESILPPLTDKQKKFLIITSIVIAILTACYVAFNCCVDEKTWDRPSNKPQPPRFPIKRVIEERKEDKLQEQPKKIPFEVRKKGSENEIADVLKKDSEVSDSKIESKPKIPVQPTIPDDMTPITPKLDEKPAEDIKQKQITAIKEKIFDELKKKDLNGDQLNALIEEYSKLSLSMPGTYLITYEEILKTFAAMLHDAIDSKATWNQLMPVVVKVIWKMQDYNPLKRPEYEEVFDRTILLRKEFLSLDLKMRGILAERDSAEQSYSIYLQEANNYLSDPRVSAATKQLFTDTTQKKTTKRNMQIKNYEEQIETIRTRLKDLSVTSV